MSDEFGYGPRWAWNTTCCGKPAGCTNMSDQCLLRAHPWKQRNNVTDLVGFVTARLDEDEAAAKTAVVMGAGVWALAPHFHTARHSPDRVLREVEAKRAILAEYAPVAGNDGIDEPEYASGWATGLGTAVRALAGAWSDHQDYRPEWAVRPGPG